MARSKKILKIAGWALTSVGTLVQLFDFVTSKRINFYIQKDIRLTYFLVLLGLFLILISVALSKIEKFKIDKKKFKERFKFEFSFINIAPFLVILLVIIFYYPVTNDIISKKHSTEYEGLAEEQISWLLDNKIISLELSNDIYHLNSYIKRVIDFNSPYIEKISNILLDTIDVLGANNLAEYPYEIVYRKYCLKDENSSLDPQEELNSEKLKKDYAYYLSLKGLIAKETCYEGSNKDRFGIAEKYFDRALDYYEMCPIALNGKGIILLYKLRQEGELTPYSVKLARLGIEKFIETENAAKFKSIFIKGRRSNNIVCADLNTLNNIFISGKLEHVNPELKDFYDKLPSDEQTYFKPFVDDLENKFETIWDTLLKARRNISTIPQLYLTIAEFYCLSAEYLLNYYEDPKEYKNFCTTVFTKFGPMNPKELLEKALELINTATNLGYVDFKRFLKIDDKTIRKYGYGGFITAREKNMEELYEEFISISGII